MTGHYIQLDFIIVFAWATLMLTLATPLTARTWTHLCHIISFLNCFIIANIQFKKKTNNGNCLQTKKAIVCKLKKQATITTSLPNTCFLQQNMFVLDANG